MIRSTVRTSAPEDRETSVPAITHCPECGCGMLVGAEICEICLADLGERPMAFPTADLPPAAAVADLRFGDVIAELEALARVASDREEIAEAAERVGSLLARLRTQFTQDLGLPDAPAGTSSDPP